MTNPGFNRIAIIKLSALGDIVHTIPAFHILRSRYPLARISWFAESTGALLLKQFEGIDEIIPVNLKNGSISHKLKNLRQILREFRGKFDLVIDFQGLIKSAALSWLLDCKTIGFHNSNLRERTARFFYTQKATPFDESCHVVYKNIHLVKQLFSIEPSENTNNIYPLTYPVKDSFPSPNLDAFLKQHNLKEKQFVIFNIGGGWESKILSFQQNIEVLSKIKNRYNTIILWGNEREKKAAELLTQLTHIPISEFFDFADLIRFIRMAKLVVTADTLAMHLADAVGTPSVGIFGPTSPHRNGSLLSLSIPIQINLPCRFCYKKKCAKMDCITKIKTESIVEAIEKGYRT